MNSIDYIRKENANYLARNKKCNSLDLELWQFKDYLEDRDGDTEHERELLAIMEREVNNLRYTLECYKKELDRIHFDTIEKLKGEY